MSPSRLQSAGPVPAPAVARPETLHDVVLHEGPYEVRFARDEVDLERVLRLRFSIFNEELGEGLDESWETGLDTDRFDRVCDHLMLVDRRDGALVGTYRMQTAEMARAGAGFYCDEEFDLSSIPEAQSASAIELGRACILGDHRNGLALYALWRGLALYLTWTGKHLLFGCCSLTSQDPREGVAMLRYLEERGKTTDTPRVLPRPGFECALEPGDERPLPEVKVPRLFGTYLRYGALACGPPAIDRSFKTIDFFIVLDASKIDDRVRAMFFANLPQPPQEGEAS